MSSFNSLSEFFGKMSNRKGAKLSVPVKFSQSSTEEEQHGREFPRIGSDFLKPLNRMIRSKSVVGAHPRGSFSGTDPQLNHKREKIIGDDILLEPLFTGQAIHVGEYPDSPIDHVKQMLEGEDPKPKIFCEMMELFQDTAGHHDCTCPATYKWRQKARWIRFEEEVEEGGTRFSKPHITLLTIQSLLQLKNCLRRGASLLDVDVNNFPDIVDAVAKKWLQRHELVEQEVQGIAKVLLAEKQHMVGNRLRSSTRGPPSTSFEGGAESSDEDSGNPVFIPSQASSAKSTILKKLPSDTESAVVLVGHLAHLETPLTEFVRLQSAVTLYPTLPEVPIPVRFLFFLLTPRDHYPNEMKQIGKCMGTLMTDEMFGQVAYVARDGYALADGLEEFLSQTLIVPAGKWNLGTRFEPNDEALQTERRVGYPVIAESTEREHPEDLVISRTGTVFGGLVEDVKLKLSWYASDFVDAIRGRITQTLGATIFLFFANISKIITFGGVMGEMLEGRMGTVENLVSGGICGVIYALFSGQPIAVLSATGPTLVFEFIMYDLCKSIGWDYLVARFWLGLWTAIFLLIIVATDASVIIGLITRFTEEAFATLISIIFIVQAFEYLFEISHEAPITTDPRAVLQGYCHCNVSTGINNTNYNLYTNLTEKSCEDLGGLAEGIQCNFQPDVFLFSVILFLGTFFIAMTMKKFRTSGFLPSKLRQAIADFNVLTAIVVMTAVNVLVGLDVPQLKVPDEFKPTMDRPWFVNPLDLEVWWISLVAALPAIFLTILVFMDQQITAVIVNRKDNRLRKGHGYHLDLVVIAFLMVICSLIGIPYYVAATVISIIHLESLKVNSECAAPGEKPQFLGVKEQRVTALVAHILIGMAVFLTPVIKVVPMPVLLGVFLYMGFVSLIGQQFVQRITILFMPMKYQPDYSWLRVVHLKRVHLFTLIQMISLCLLFVVKYTKSISMVFPVMLIAMVIMRFLMNRIFTRKELRALDDPLPTIRELMRVRKPIKLEPAAVELEANPKLKGTLLTIDEGLLTVKTNSIEDENGLIET